MTEKLASKILKRVKAVDADKVLDAMALPQRILMRRAAELVGAEPGEDSETSAFNIVDKVSERLGLPEDSIAINALKAGAVAGLETFGDPTGPIGKLAKFNKVKGLISKIAPRARKGSAIGAKYGDGEFLKNRALTKSFPEAIEARAVRKAEGRPVAIQDKPIEASQRLSNRPTMQIGPDKGAAEKLAKMHNKDK